MPPAIDWKPPAEPNPTEIFHEAKTDTAARRYSEALAKHVWFHENALKYQESLYGVRLSYALEEWVKLGAVYPPALEKLKNIRDQAAQNVRGEKEIRPAFHDFAALNQVLTEEDKTSELFVWLDTNKPSLAKAVFDLAQPALINAKQYLLCGPYIDADTSLQEMVQFYRVNQKMATSPPFDTPVQEADGTIFSLKDFGVKSFCNGVATLVALLVLNDRKADADRVAAEAVKEWEDPRFKEELEKAKNGNVPPPYPGPDD